MRVCTGNGGLTSWLMPWPSSPFSTGDLETNLTKANLVSLHNKKDWALVVRGSSKSMLCEVTNITFELQAEELRDVSQVTHCPTDNIWL